MTTPKYTIWFTGLSASGKSTIASALANDLSSRVDCPVQILDGDIMRKHINRDLGYSQADRNMATERIAHMASLLNENGVICVVSNISQDRRVRRLVREIVDQLVMVFVDTPIDVCAARDKKGNYLRAFSGEMSNFVGVTMPYESPTNADIVIDTLVNDPQMACRKIRSFLEETGKLN